MQWISNILGIDKIQYMKKEQLAAQASADECLRELVSECPETVAEFLLSIRSASRDYQARILNAPLSGVKEELLLEHQHSMFTYGRVRGLGGDAKCKCQALKDLQNARTVTYEEWLRLRP
jgi:hypothetical protein